jgi:hypothetical protein
VFKEQFDKGVREVGVVPEDGETFTGVAWEIVTHGTAESIATGGLPRIESLEYCFSA